MPQVSEIEKSRSKRTVAKSIVTRRANRITKLISEKESVAKVRQFANTIEEAKTKARDLTKR